LDDTLAGDTAEIGHEAGERQTSSI
jgi:hypothetical protein